MNPKQLFVAAFVDVCFQAEFSESGNHPIHHAHAKNKERACLQILNRGERISLSTTFDTKFNGV